jgi:hypothetical protein
MVIYNLLMYVHRGIGLIWVVVLSQPQIHRNAVQVCELIGDDIKQHDLNLTENQILTYREH